MLVNQIALNGTVPLDSVVAFYVEGLGFLPTGGMSISGAELARLQGLDVDKMRAELRWAVGRAGFMQLELFAYTQPECRPRRADWSPADVGYNVVTVHVRDFDATLGRLARRGAVPVSDIAGPAGARRACVADPNGNLVELVEHDPAPDVEAARPEINADIRGVRVTVPDLVQARRFFTESLGLVPAGVPAHDETHESLWGLAGRSPELVTLTDGRTFVELANYGKATRGWPEGYRITDEGVLNIALASTDKQDYLDTCRRVAAGPHTMHPEAVLRPDLQGTYVTNDQGLSVELIYWAPSAWAEFGLAPAPQAGTQPAEDSPR
jgi:catechol 2,3-dioxygenase-like lactoylglutathione lyase family enzyme